MQSLCPTRTTHHNGIALWESEYVLFSRHPNLLFVDLVFERMGYV